MSISVREFNDIGQLEPLRYVWNQLLEQTSRPNFFLTLDWLQVYWRHFGFKQKLRVLVVEEDGEPIGIVPLTVRRDTTRLGRLKFLTYPLDFWGSFYSPIGARRSAIAQAALEHVRSTPRDWQVFEPRWLDNDWLSLFSDAGAMQFAGLPGYITQMDETSLIELTGTWEEYLTARGSKYRNNFRRWERKLAECGPISYVRHRPAGDANGDADPRWDLYDICEEIARQSWQGSSQTGTTLSSPEIRDYLRDLHTTASRVGGVDLSLLYIGDRAVAYAYNYYFNGNVYGLRVGYDEAASKDGAGNLLYMRIIEDSFRRGDKLYDLGPGSFEAKRHIKTASAPIWRVSHYAPVNIRAQLVRWRRSREARRAELAPALAK